jgi:heat shock protein HslJ
VRLVPAAAAAWLAIGCTGFGGLDARALEGSHWQVIEVAGKVPVAGREPTIKLGPGNVSGFAGCNEYASAAFVIEGDRLLTGGLGTGAVVCEDPRVMAVEEAYYDALLSVERIEVRDGLLVLSGTAGELVFRRISG